MKYTVIFILSILLHSNLYSQLAEETKAPYLKKQGNATQLIVDNKPFLMLAGELGNSSASDLRYMEPIWSKLVKMNINTVLVPVYWELLEPAEGKFDFTLVDSLIKDAGKYNIKMVILWFGSWKNSMSCYAPLWVKTNQERFPRSATSDSKGIEILSPFSEENMKADAKAFASLMRHIKVVDSDKHTVIMVQVENEIGMIPEARDHSLLANKRFYEPVPSDLIKFLVTNKENLIPEFKSLWEKNGFKKTGTWEEVFGKSLETDELFMAWYFARYTNFVAASGKKEYSIPMYVNAALIREGYKPGQYPSAGPLPHLMDIWKAGAPQIDFFSPDFYNPRLVWWCTQYNRQGNPMFIPEAANNQSMTNAFYAIGQHNSMGYSPFSIENVADTENSQVARAYDVLNQLSSLILEKQGKDEIKGVVLDSTKQVEDISMGNYTFHIKHEYSWPYASKLEGKTPRFGGMIIMLAPDEFYVAGSGLIITFDDNTGAGFKAGIGSIDEGEFIDGSWVPGLRLNGDEDHQGRHLHIDGLNYSIKKLKLYSYK